jgi:hypothetical protein
MLLEKIQNFTFTGMEGKEFSSVTLALPIILIGNKSN